MKFTVAQVTTDQLKVVGVTDTNKVILEKFLEGAVNMFTGEKRNKLFRIELKVPDAKLFESLSNKLGKEINATMQFNEDDIEAHYLIDFTEVK